jgi:hypothetical protein
VTRFYTSRGGLSAFYQDYQAGTFPPEIAGPVLELLKSLRTTITTMPMRYLGRSLFKDEYSIFQFTTGSRFPPGLPIDQQYLIRHAGTFTFSRELFAVFQYLGSFLSGEDSILYRWATFSAGADRSGAVTPELVLERLRTVPETERSILDARRVYLDRFATAGSLECVWTGKAIRTPQHLQIDHAIPFSLWKNNQLWNLLPVEKHVNARKRAQIPGPALVEARSEEITGYWTLLDQAYPHRFRQELAVSLTGGEAGANNLIREGIDHLIEKCEYLIEIRGFHILLLSHNPIDCAIV